MEDYLIYSRNNKILKGTKYNRLDTVSIKEGTKTIKKEAFQNVFLNKIIFPKSLEKIEQYAFNCSAIKEIKIENKVEIEKEAFMNTPLLSKVEINCEVLPSWCFYNSCNKDFSKVDGLDIYLENTITIEDLALSYCHINILQLPSTLKYIYSRAFEGSTFKETKIVLPENLVAIGTNAFSGTNITDVYLPESIELVSDIKKENITYHISESAFNRIGVEKTDNIIFYTFKELLKRKTFKEINEDKLDNFKVGFKDEFLKENIKFFI